MKQKKIIAAFLAAAMVLGGAGTTVLQVLPKISLTASAEGEELSGTFGENLTWEVRGTTLYIKGCGYMGEKKPWIKKIPDITAITHIVIEDGVKNIGDEAFRGFSGVTNVTLPASLTSIGNTAFSGCSSLTFVYIQDDTRYIGKNAFAGCRSLTGLHIGSGITEIPDHAFCRCSSLKSVDFPPTVTRIGDGAFSDCSSLEKVVLPPEPVELEEIELKSNNTEICSYVFSGSKWLSKLKESGEPVIINNCVLDGGDSISGEVYVPNGVTRINSGAYNSVKLTGLHIPASVKKIDRWAINAMHLENFYLESNDINISSSSFLNVPWYTNLYKNNDFVIFDGILLNVHNVEGDIEVPDGVEVIGEGAFSDCKETKLVIPDSVTYLGEGAFKNNTQLTDLTIGCGIDTIRDYTFENCKIADLKIPDRIEYIGDYAFAGCKFKKLTLPEQLQYVGKFAFASSGISELEVNDALEMVDEMAFYDNYFNSVKLPG